MHRGGLRGRDKKELLVDDPAVTARFSPGHSGDCAGMNCATRNTQKQYLISISLCIRRSTGMRGVWWVGVF